MSPKLTARVRIEISRKLFDFRDERVSGWRTVEGCAALVVVSRPGSRQRRYFGFGELPAEAIAQAREEMRRDRRLTRASFERVLRRVS